MITLGRCVRVLTFVLVGTSSAAAIAQEPSGWDTIPLDAASSTVGTRGNTLSVQLADRVLLYSPYLHEWTVVPVSAAASVTNQNEHVIIQDGQTFHGWSPWVGIVSTITLSGAGGLVPGPSSASFIVLAQDGTTVYGFSAQDGEWRSQTIGSAAPSVALDRQCAIVHDGATAYGFGLDGQWVAQPAVGATTIGSDGHVAWANDATTFRCFSGERSVWGELTVSSTAILDADSGFAMITEGNLITAFSAYRGTFASVSAPTSGLSISKSSNVAAIVDGNTLIGYSAFAGSFQTTTLDTPVLDVTTSLFVASSVLDNKSVAFSGLLGSFSPDLAGAFTISTNDTVALAEGPGAFAYSAMTGAWAAAPGTYSAVNLLDSSIVFTEASAWTAYSGRTGGFTSLASSGVSALYAPSNNRGSVAAATDDNGLHVWNPRLSRWDTAKIDASALNQVIANFSAALAENGSAAYAFGAFGVGWESVNLSGPILSLNSGSGVGYVQTADHLHVYSAYDTLNVITKFPESTGHLVRGETARLLLTAPESSLAFLGVDTQAGSTLTPYGELLIQTVAPIALPVVPPGGRLEIAIPIPGAPALAGLTFHFQAVVVPPTGTPYLTGSTSPVIL